MDKGSKVTGVYSTDAHLYTPGIKRVGGPLADVDKPSKVARYTVTDLLPDDEQGQQKWRGDPEETFSDWTIEITFEGPVPVPASAPAPAPEAAASDAAAAAGAAGRDVEMGTPDPNQAAPTAVATAGETPATTAAATAPPAEQPKEKASTSSEVIEIQTQTDIYHVHRYFLGFGTRRSQYFAKLFKEQRSGISKKPTTKLELEPLAAKAFPDLLDFLYDPAMPLVISTETAAALHYLGVRFEMAHLQHYAKEFIQKDLSLETLETYYQHAKIFDDPVVMDSIVDFVGKNIGALSSTSAFVKQQTDAQLWKASLQHVKLHPSNFSADLHLSKIVAEFGHSNKDTLDAQTFQELTSPEKIRKVDPSVAFDLVALDDLFMGPEDGVSSLQQRCATALAESWKELDASDDNVKSRKSAFLVDLLGKCLHEAKTENERLTGVYTTSRGRQTTAASRGSRGDRVESASVGPASRRSGRAPH